MSIQERKKTSKVDENDLKLDPEAVKDLEPTDARANVVKGGQNTRGCGGGGNLT